MKAIAYTDGGGNTGHLCTCGVLLRIEDVDPPWEFAKVLPNSYTNNEAEYEGVIFALDKALKKSVTSILIRSDSDLIVNQIRGRYKTENPRLKPLLEKAVLLICAFDEFHIEWIPREQNKDADALCREVKATHLRDDRIHSINRRKKPVLKPRRRPSPLQRKNPFRS